MRSQAIHLLAIVNGCKTGVNLSKHQQLSRSCSKVVVVTALWHLPCSISIQQDAGPMSVPAMMTEMSTSQFAIYMMPGRSHTLLQDTELALLTCMFAVDWLTSL